MKFDREKFWRNYRETFGKVSQKVVDSIEELLHGFETFKEWKDLRHVAYALATIKAETAHTFEPIPEYGKRAYFNRYEGRADLGNTQKGDGYKFRGRGYVQITGRDNYAKFSKLLGIDLIVNPELALLVSNALYILTVGMHKGLFTGKKLSDYINGTAKSYYNARAIINGDKAIIHGNNKISNGKMIANYAEQFEQILRNSAVVPATKPATINQTAETDNSAEIPSVLTPETNEQPPNESNAVETAEIQTETQTATVTTTKNEQSVHESADVTEPKPQGVFAKLTAGIGALFSGTFIYTVFEKFGDFTISNTVLILIIVAIILAFLGFCFWAWLDAVKANNRVKIEAEAKTNINKKDVNWV